MTPRSTMNGPARALASVMLAGVLLAAGLAPPAAAQPRTFADPPTRLGTLEIRVFPQARLDDKDVLLAPGVRIRNESNLLAVPSTIVGTVPVRYRLDLLGQVLDAWILTPEELKIAQEEARQQAARR